MYNNIIIVFHQAQNFIGTLRKLTAFYRTHGKILQKNIKTIFKFFLI